MAQFIHNARSNQQHLDYTPVQVSQDPLAVRLSLLLIGRVEGFHLQVSVPFAGRTKKTGAEAPVDAS